MDNCVGTVGITYVCEAGYQIPFHTLIQKGSLRTHEFQNKLNTCFGISVTLRPKNPAHMDQDFPVLGTIIYYGLNQFFEICTHMLCQTRLEFRFVYISLYCPIITYLDIY